MLRKGQAAMEFLMTYGWAILVVLIAIGALAYFGVLNPSRFLPESCTIGPGISCDEFKITSAGAITLVLRNGMGSQLTSVVVRVNSDGNGAACTVPPACGTDCGILDDGEQDTYAGSGCQSGSAGGKFKGQVYLEYTKDAVSHNKTGSLTMRYE